MPKDDELAISDDEVESEWEKSLIALEDLEDIPEPDNIIPIDEDQPDEDNINTEFAVDDDDDLANFEDSLSDPLNITSNNDSFITLGYNNSDNYLVNIKPEIPHVEKLQEEVDELKKELELLKQKFKDQAGVEPKTKDTSLDNIL